MQLRKRKRHAAEVNLSSFTDIIFMLMVFFMLTSSLVKFLEFDLPKSNVRSKAPNKINVEIRADGAMQVNDRDATEKNLEAIMREEIAKKQVPNSDITITILAESIAERKFWDLPVRVANKLKVKAILGTDPIQ